MPASSLRMALGALLVAALVAIPSAPADAATTSMSFSYTQTAGPVPLAKIMKGSQGGYLSAQNLNWFTAQIPELARMGLKEIRIDHLLEDGFYTPVSRNQSGQLQYDFSRLDRVVLGLVQNGIRPFMCLSYMPSALGPAWNAPATNLAEWAATARAVVDHYEGLGITGLDWEIWNEPEWFWTGTMDQYNAMYEASARAVKDADATAKVGGAGFANIGSTQTAAFLDWYRTHLDVPMDFLSWHHYASDDFATVSTAQSMLSQRGIPAKRLLVNEWNSTSNMTGSPGAVPDTNVNAAYAARRLSRALDNPSLGGAYFFSPMEGWTPTAGFSGDLGMLTANGHRKAVANVFEMYGKLGPERLITTGGLGDRSLYGVATRDPAHNRVAVVMWNHTSAASRIDISLTNLPYLAANQTFRAVRTVVDAGNGNYYADWSAGVRGQRPGPHEYPVQVQNQTIAPTSSFAGPVNLPPNSVTLLTLQPVAEGPPVFPAPVDDLAAGRTVASSSSYESPSQGWGRTRLVDTMRHSLTTANAEGPTSGFTSTGYADPNHLEWVQVDLGSARPFNHIRLWPRDDQAAEGASFPVDFTLAASNGPTGPWTFLHTATNYAGGQRVVGPQSFSFPLTTLRYVRVTATKLGVPVLEPATTYRLQLAELEVERR